MYYLRPVPLYLNFRNGMYLCMREGGIAVILTLILVEMIKLSIHWVTSRTGVSKGGPLSETDLGETHP
jgi:hypothetical protein